MTFSFSFRSAPRLLGSLADSRNSLPIFSLSPLAFPPDSNNLVVVNYHRTIQITTSSDPLSKKKITVYGVHAPHPFDHVKRSFQRHRILDGSGNRHRDT